MTVTLPHTIRTEMGELAFKAMLDQIRSCVSRKVGRPMFWRTDWYGGVYTLCDPKNDPPPRRAP